ncbi:hypothetical protein BDV98DRAFT_43498 [Pterulicium gracile]|uniref:Uncharacterized protein n=1 Tax=Pterulicium gracile TaxID=1884261 RepID=A0A5C3QL59_9AGAR|nr:hypothetical protein BDV98DRAFT_43498 [Pterula gracilis]
MTLMFLDLYSISPNYPHPVQLCVLLFIPIVALGPIILLDQHLEGPILTLRALRIRALNDLSYYLIVSPRSPQTLKVSPAWWKLVRSSVDGIWISHPLPYNNRFAARMIFI